ncbi:MAG: tryptophan--tRNA ligase [Oscillospiraceae bacterium]|nr:tryptophan--tRNA ligase [Oscillospiraceae bacterium]
MSEQVQQTAETGQKKKRILSGIQPTGTFTLGNYIGAVRNWGPLQDEYECFYFIADLHAITVAIEPAELRRKSLEAYAQLLACGIDLEKSLVFIQSQIPTHAQLSWVLNCSTQFGELSRMTQFKDKSAKHPDNINAGLFDYPVLMAADILIYNADLVPVGADQTQHLEIARTIARRFNQRYGETFKIPEGYIPPLGAKIMSLQEPTKKMSKSDTNPNAVILILDDKDTIIRKCKRAVTDSGSEVVYAEGKDGINNLLTIYSTVTGRTIEESVKEFEGQGYGTFKVAVGEAIADHLRPVREEYARLIADKAYLKECYTRCGTEALRQSSRLLSKVYRKVGFVQSEIR